MVVAVVAVVVVVVVVVAVDFVVEVVVVVVYQLCVFVGCSYVVVVCCLQAVHVLLTASRAGTDGRLPVGIYTI